jgi:hypothetical protein
MSKVRGRPLEKDDDSDNSELDLRAAHSNQWAVTKSAPVPHNNSKTNRTKQVEKSFMLFKYKRIFLNVPVYKMR